MKTVLEILNRYQPDSTARAILERAENPVVRADKENRALQMELDFPRLVDKEELYRIEEDVAKAQGLIDTIFADGILTEADISAN